MTEAQQAMNVNMSLKFDWAKVTWDKFPEIFNQIEWNIKVTFSNMFFHNETRDC